MALPHVDERQLLFQGVLTLVPNQEREREPPHFYLPPLPSLFIPWTQSFPVPCAPFLESIFIPGRRWKTLACFPALPRQPPVGRGGGASGCLERLGRCRRATLYSPLPYKHRDSRATSHLCCGMPRPGSQEMKRSSVFEGQPLSVLLFGSAVARLHFEVWEVKITGMALCHSIGPFTSWSKSKSLQLGPTHLLPSV